MSETRKRDHTITIRGTKAEKERMIRKARKAKMSLTDYILTLSDQQAINPPPDFAPVLRELKRIGNNINQIAMKVNAGMTYVPDLSKIISAQNKIYEQLLRMTEDASWRR